MTHDMHYHRPNQHFKTFILNLKIDASMEKTIAHHAKNITQQINADFWGIKSSTEHAHFIGSYGRGTAIRALDDVDMAVEFPFALQKKYQADAESGAEALLQKIQQSLALIYPQSVLGEDGRTINIALPGLTFEVLPAFLQADQSFLYPQAFHGSRWRTARPLAENEAIETMDKKFKGKVRDLIKMMLAWKIHNQAPLSGFLIETLVMDFYPSWAQHTPSNPYEGVLATDFFHYLAEQDQNQKHWRAYGSEQFVYRRGPFEENALKSLQMAQKALNLEARHLAKKALELWAQIFGDFFLVNDNSRE